MCQTTCCECTLVCCYFHSSSKTYPGSGEILHMQHFSCLAMSPTKVVCWFLLHDQVGQSSNDRAEELQSVRECEVLTRLVNNKVMRSLCEPGEAVGLVCAQVSQQQSTWGRVGGWVGLCSNESTTKCLEVVVVVVCARVSQ